MSKVLVALSGGLDSSYTAYLLKNQGYHVDGIHFSNGLVNDDNTDLIHKISQILEIDVQFIDIQQQFEQLLDEIDIEMCHRSTPNICVLCARNIKFGYVMNYALEHGYDYLATGHYVQITETRDDVIIDRAIDQSKDQSYGFSVIPKKQLRHALTPLGKHIKTTIRRHALELGLPFIHRESHGLCFKKTGVSFTQFYNQYTKYALISGQFIEPNGTCEHHGQQLYTKGQKVHINGKKLFVKDKLSNGDIIITTRENLFENIVKITKINYMIDPDQINLAKQYQIMIRYNTVPVKCLITDITDDCLTVRTESPVFAPTSGQIGAIYDGIHVLIGGFIC